MSIDLNTIISAKLTAYDNADNLNKKKILGKIDTLASEFNPDIKRGTLFEALQHRERLGNTAIGNGIAIPHARIAGLKKPMCIVILLNQTINFDPDATEATEVDLIFSLLVPEKKDALHLEILAALTEKLKDPLFIRKLRDAKSSEELYQYISNLL